MNSKMTYRIQQAEYTRCNETKACGRKDVGTRKLSVIAARAIEHSRRGHSFTATYHVCYQPGGIPRDATMPLRYIHKHHVSTSTPHHLTHDKVGLITLMPPDLCPHRVTLEFVIRWDDTFAHLHAFNLCPEITSRFDTLAACVRCVAALMAVVQHRVAAVLAALLVMTESFSCIAAQPFNVSLPPDSESLQQAVDRAAIDEAGLVFDFMKVRPDSMRLCPCTRTYRT